MFNWGLFGVLSVQTYMYYSAFPNDALKFQALVYGVYLVETVQTILVTHDAFQTFAFGYGNIFSLNSVQLIWFHACVLPGLVAFTVQIYFAYRIFLLSRSKIVSIIIAVTALMEFIAAVTTGVMAKQNATFSGVAEDKTMIPVVGVWLAGSAFCDILIAMSMTYVLSKYDGSFAETRDRVNRIIRLTMETGSLTAVIAVVDLILFVKFPAQDYHICPAITLAKLYSNSLLVVFNSRMRIPNSRGHSTSRSDSHAVNGNNSMVFRTTDVNRRPEGIQVRVEEASVWNDEYAMDHLKSNSNPQTGRVYNIGRDISRA
ncbi:hypothetical protein PM082_020919 [Marasmius tenuissimus]|nr:hypothetical protein PM082_020919 [Marasmius tenuissimus]